MAINTIYIARHGYRSNWLPKGPYPLPPTGVDSDVPLAEHGIDQAKELAHYILSLDNQPELVFSSPFYRCIQTTQQITDLLELPIYVDTGIGEWYKPDRPTIPEPASLEVLNQLFLGKISDEWEYTITPSNEGESEEDIFERCSKFWPMFIQKVEKNFPNVETILLITHAATKVTLGMTLLKFKNCREHIDDDGTIIRSGSCSLDKYEVIPQNPLSNKTHSYDVNDEEEESAVDIPVERRRWRITMNGNTEFLRKGEEMNWNFQSAFEAGSDADIRARKLAAEASGKDLSLDLNDIAKGETETVYVSLDIPSGNYRGKTYIDRTATLQYSGLETDDPLFKIGDKIYEGNWKKLVGTELAFPDAAIINKKNSSKEERISTNDSTAKSQTLKDTSLSSNERDKHSKNSSVENEEGEIIDDDDNENKDDHSQKNEVHSEKIYRVTDRIILSEVKPM